jgi:ketosteroid isomerase-like protein
VTSSDSDPLRSFAEAYTAAWCSQDAGRVAACYSEDDSLSVNEGPPAVGRPAITEVAQGFMTDFPDLRVLMDDLMRDDDHALYHWTLIGTNTGPSGTGNRVRISGFEVWRIGVDWLIAESRGSFDAAAYQYQIEHGVVKPD